MQAVQVELEELVVPEAGGVLLQAIMVLPATVKQLPPNTINVKVGPDTRYPADF